MNRRHFLTTAGGATAAASLLQVNTALASETTTPFFVKGLIMVSFEDPQVLRLGFPKATGHKATLAVVPQKGSPKTLNLKGAYTAETAIRGSGRREYKIPELIWIQQLYGGDIHSRVQECPTIISIPYAAIQSITTVEVSPTRYTFIRADTGDEIPTFRPRKVADTLRIDLSSDAVIKLDNGKSPVAMKSLKEAHAEYLPDAPPTRESIDAFTAHFPHYMAYMDRPSNANYDVLPRNLGATSSPTPSVGHHFAPYWPYYLCFVIGM